MVAPGDERKREGFSRSFIMISSRRWVAGASDCSGTPAALRLYFLGRPGFLNATLYRSHKLQNACGEAAARLQVSMTDAQVR